MLKMTVSVTDSTQKHGKAVAQNFFRTFTVAGAQLDGSQRRAAHSGECGKGRDQQDDGERNAHACQRKCACAGMLPM